MTWSSDFIAIAPTLHNTCSIVQCMHPEILNSSQLLNYILKPCIKTSQCALKAFVTQCKNVIRFTKKTHVEDLISSLPPFTPKKSSFRTKFFSYNTIYDEINGRIGHCKKFTD